MVISSSSSATRVCVETPAPCIPPAPVMFVPAPAAHSDVWRARRWSQRRGSSRRRQSRTPRHTPLRTLRRIPNRTRSPTRSRTQNPTQNPTRSRPRRCDCLCLLCAAFLLPAQAYAAHSCPVQAVNVYAARLFVLMIRDHSTVLMRTPAVHAGLQEGSDQNVQHSHEEWPSREGLLHASRDEVRPAV